ncbi:MAG: hypothetical protein ACLVAA_05350 [Ruthenibacterium sp.]
MTKMKKLLAVVLVCAIMAVCGASAFADWTIVPDTGNSINYLNIYGNTGSALQGRPLTLWRVSGVTGQDQKFLLRRVIVRGDTGYVLSAAQNTNYAVNRRDNDGHAIMWSISSGWDDSRIHKPMSDPSNLIILQRTNEHLSCNGDYSGADVWFGGSRLSQWIASGTPTLPIYGDLPISGQYS